MVLIHSSHEEQIWRFAQGEPDALGEFPRWQDQAFLRSEGFLPLGRRLQGTFTSSYGSGAVAQRRKGQLSWWTMKQNEIIQSLRTEIAKLQRVLNLLLEQTTETEPVRRPGRPKGPSNKATSFDPEEFAPKKRTMSAEGKARIAAAQKKRWAAQKAVLRKRSSKALPAAAKKSEGAGKRSGSTRGKTQTVSTKRATIVAKESAGKKTVAKRASRPATKRPAKRAAASAPEPQATA